MHFYTFTLCAATLDGVGQPAGMLRLEWFPPAGRNHDLDGGMCRGLGPGEGNAYLGRE